ncbi:MAG TPA: hypothetical protein VEA44_10100 [Caulobacter sp.]|nr:hypothetical protein [Caulobacter sp.]
MKVAPLLPVLLLLCACEQPAAQKPQPAPVPSPSPAAQTSWTLTVTGAGLALAHGAADRVDLRLFCRRDGRFGAEAPLLSPIASEERFSLGAGGDAFVLVADPVEGAAGVTAEGPIEEGLLAAIGSGQPIGASYGAHAVGPLAAPPAEMRSSFVSSCRAILLETAKGL